MLLVVTRLEEPSSESDSCAKLDSRATGTPDASPRSHDSLFASVRSRSAWRICSTKPEVCAYSILSPQNLNRRMAAALPGEESNARLRHLAHNLEGELKPEKVFFIWIRCNPLKSPDSGRKIQGNPSIFPWFYLVQLGFAWTEFARKLYLRSLGSVQLRPPADLPTRPARSTAPSRRPGASPSRSARRQSAASAPAPRRRGGTPRRACGPSRDPVLPRRG